MVVSKFAAKLAAWFAVALLVSLPALSNSAVPKSAPVAGHIHTTAAPAARVVTPVDNSKRTTLYGHVPGVLRAATDLGRLDPKTPAEHLILVLSPSDEQKSELRRVLDEQQDVRTANYHQWVTPDQFGQFFGVHDDDIAQVSAWLQSQGFTVEDVSKSKRVLHFSGTTGQLERAFQTQMHTFSVHGETHVSNNSDISIPKALSPVIQGVTLNNFFPKAKMGPVHRLSELRQNPEFTNGSTNYVSPGDFATIYNTQPLLNAGINGTGSSIAIVGRSDILLSDVQTYRQLFNLPVNDPIFIHAGQDNGIEPGDDGESDLDVEISGGIAPMAQIYFVIGTPTFLVDGITNSIMYIVENNVADIMSISYGSCEAAEGYGGNALNQLGFEQAAAQGISVFVASGDNGPADCDVSGDSFETYGYATGAEASTPYNVAVGGSMFTEGGSNTTYWGVTNPLTEASALSYVPEYPWNEAKGADITSSSSLSGIWSGSGGISSFYTQPSWQRGPGVLSADPDLTQAAYGGQWVAGYNITNPGSGYVSTPTVTFTGGGCTAEPNFTAVLSAGSVVGFNVNYYSHTGQGIGCTSAPTMTISAAPAGGTTATATAIIGPMQSVPPLIAGVPHRYVPDIALNAASGHDGTLFCSEGVCEISSTGTLQDAGIVGGTSVAAPSMAGIQALINQANGGRQGAPNYIYYSLAAAENTQGCNSSLPPLAGSNCAFQDITVGDNLICGTSTCSATTGTKIGFSAGVGYDMASGLGSVNAANLSSQWKNVVFNSSNTTLNVAAASHVSTNGSPNSGIAQGAPVIFSGTVAAGSQNGTPTGDVAIILSQGELGVAVNLNTGSLNGNPSFATLDSGGNFSATLGNLPAGSYNVTARYGGDENFASSVSPAVPVTVLQGNATVTITPEYFADTTTCSLNYVSSYNYGQFAWIPAAVTSNTGQGVPTGTVTFTVDGTTYATEQLDPQGNGYLAAGTIATGSCLYDYIFAQSPTLTAGQHVIGAWYSGDSTFSAATATPVSITVNQLTVTPTLAAGATNITAGASVPLTATLTTSALTGTTTTNSGPTGTVTFTDTTTSTVLGTATVNPTVSFSGNTYTYGARTSLTTTAIAASGAHAITAAYSGDTNFAAATSSAVTVTVGTGAGTTTTVTSSANPTTLNGRPTLTATIGLSGSGTAPTSGTVSFYDSFAGYPVLLGTGTVGSSHTATYRPSSGAAFWAGAHQITAVYGGVAADAGSTSPAFTQNVTQGTTTIVLTAKTAGTYGQTYTFAAVVTPSQSNGTYAPNQSVVNFYDGSTLIGSAQPMTITSSQGGYGIWTATLATVSLSGGSHTITAQYSDINYSLSTSNAQTVNVNQAAQAIKFSLASPVTYGVNPIMLSATGGGSGNPVTFSVLSGPGTVSGSVLTVTGAGSIVIAADQASNINYLAAPEVTQTLVVNKAPQAIRFSVSSPVTYTTIPIALSATGGGSNLAVSFSLKSGPGSLNGSTLTITGVGSIVIAADEAGNSNYLAAPEVLQTLVVNKATPGVVLTSITNPVLVQNSTTLTATVTGTSTPTGSVTFLDGTTPIGSGQLNASGVATLAIATLTVGSHSITAAYSGDADYTAFTSLPLTQVVEDFNLSISSSTGVISQMVAAGGTATFTFTVTPASPATTFPASVTFSASGMPSGTNYTFVPATIAAGAGPTTVTLSVQVPAATAANTQPRLPHSAAPFETAHNKPAPKPASKLPFLAFALILLPFAGRMRRAGKKLGRVLPLLVLLVAGLAAAASMGGCGGNSLSGQPQTTYSLQVTGTSGSLSHTFDFTLTIVQ